MAKTINLASTEEISKTQLDKIMKEVALIANKKILVTKKELDQKNNQELKNAIQRFKK